MKELNIAIVGAGFVGPIHVEALRRLGVNVAGIVDVNKQRTRQVAKELNIPRAYSSYEEMLNDPVIDCIHIASPNRHHYSQASEALKANKHVVVEKPLAMTAKESAKLVKLAKKSQKIAAVNYNLRFYPLCIEARELIRKGKLGAIFSIHGEYLQDWLLYPTDYNWRVLAEEGGELRAISDIGTHLTDLITFVTGLEIEAVFADLLIVHPTRLRPLGEVDTFSGKGKQERIRREKINVTTEDYGTVLLRFKGGVHGSIRVSQVAAGYKNRLSFKISGETSSVAWNSEVPNELWIGHRDSANEIVIRDPSLLSETAASFTDYPGGHNEGFPDTSKQLYKEIHNHINGAKTQRLYPTFEDGHREIVLCEAIAKSNKKKKWVKIKA